MALTQAPMEPFSQAEQSLKCYGTEQTGEHCTYALLSLTNDWHVDPLRNSKSVCDFMTWPSNTLQTCTVGHPVPPVMKPVHFEIYRAFSFRQCLRNVTRNSAGVSAATFWGWGVVPLLYMSLYCSQPVHSKAELSKLVCYFKQGFPLEATPLSKRDNWAFTGFFPQSPVWQGLHPNGLYWFGRWRHLSRETSRPHVAFLVLLFLTSELKWSAKWKLGLRWRLVCNERIQSSSNLRKCPDVCPIC